MTEQNMDNDQAQQDTSAANASSSNGNGVSGGSFDAGKLQATLEKLSSKLEEVDARSRALQGDKDRAVTKTSKELETLKKQFAEIEKLTKGGLDLDTAVEEYDFRETVKELKSQLSKATSVPTPPVGNGEGVTTETVKVFEQFGLDPKDPRVLVEMQKSHKDPDALELAAYKLSKSLATTPNPTPSQRPAMQDGGSTHENVSEKILRLQQLQKTPTKNAAAIKKLVAELDAANWGG